jgi:hypothetical protein
MRGDFYIFKNYLQSCRNCLNCVLLMYKSIFLPVALYGCDSLSLNLREEHKLRMFENKVMRRIFGCKR